MKTSLAEHVAGLPEAERRRVLAGLEEAELASWAFWARPNQVWPEGDWRVWLVLAGRGFGKTRTGAEAVRARVLAGMAGRVALVAPTAADARDVMVEGESGLLAVSAPGLRPVFEPSKRRITWPNGAQAFLYSAEEPERLRGPQHALAWCDEACAWARAEATWDMLQFGLRLGRDPRVIVTTTPKPNSLLRSLIGREGADVVVSRGYTYDNAANLAAPFLATVRERYEGTALGRQELYAEVLSEVPGALWRRRWFEAAGFRRQPGVQERRVVGVDPSVQKTGARDACGIVGVGVDAAGDVDVLEDATVHGSPKAWAEAVAACVQRTQAGAVVVETNQGGALVGELLRGVGLDCRIIEVTASVGKGARAEPVSLLYERGRVHHAVGADLRALEDELVGWVPGARMESPNRLDALVWAVSELTGGVSGEVDVEVW